MKIFRYAGYGILIFTVLYATWHLGRAYESGTPLDFMFCQEAPDPEVLECVKLTMPARDARRLHEELMLEEIPAPKRKTELKAPRRLGI